MTPVKLTAAELETILSKLERDQYITSANSLRGHVEWLEREVERLRSAEKVVLDLLRWANAKCPCENEQPNPCPLCGASVENLEVCKAADNTLPPSLLRAARAVKARFETAYDASEHVSDKERSE